ncbi:MAG: PEP-CTERM sorting domain-containing protein [Planctomycetota bacterium]
MSLRTPWIALSLAAVLTPAAAPADVVLLDFGDTLYTGTDSPGHEDGLATGSTWNGVTGDVASGLVDQNGAALVGLALDFGTGPDATSINYSNTVRAADADHTAFPQWNDNLGTDHLVRDDSNLGPALALAVTGLADGVYDFYFTGFRGDNAFNADRNYEVRTTTSGSAVTDFSSIAIQTLTNSNPTTANSWDPGDNYITGQFTIAGGSDFYLFVDSPEQNSAGNTFIGVASSLEIVAVPEPGSLVLIGLGGLAFLARRGR